MTITTGLCFVLGILALIPLCFLFCGADTDRRSQDRRKLAEAEFDWADPSVIQAEVNREEATVICHEKPKVKIIIVHTAA